MNWLFLRQRKTPVTACITVLLGVLVSAPSSPFAQTAPPPGARPPLTEEGYEKVMKQIASTFRSLQINNKVMNHVDGEREARRLVRWFRDVQEYWETRKAQDAVDFARTAVKAAEDIEKSSTAMNMEVLQTAESTLSRACEDCHRAHREQLPDGSFRMRQ